MRLAEIKILKEYNGSSTLVVRGYDGLEPDGMYVPPFDVEIQFYSDSESSSHPYGEGSATEHHGRSVEIDSLKLKHDLEIFDDEGEHILRTFKAGTHLQKLPGWSNDSLKYFEQYVLEHASGA